MNYSCWGYNELLTEAQKYNSQVNDSWGERELIDEIYKGLKNENN